MEGNYAWLRPFEKGAIWRVANGTKVKIWRHQWIARMWSLIPLGSKRPCRLKWVSQLIRGDTREWNEEVLNKFFYSNDVAEILKIKLPSRGEEDIVAWHYEKTGYFSVRSAYRLGMDIMESEKRTSSSSCTSGDRPAWKKLWSLPVPPKVKVLPGN